MKRLWQICFTDTRVGFDGMKDSTPILFPAISTLVCVTLPFAFVGFATFTTGSDDINATNAGSSEAWLQLSTGVIWTITFVLCVVGFVCTWWLLTSVYFFGMARLFNISIPWQKWLGFSCWSAVPLITVPLVLVIAILVQIIPIPSREVDPWYIELISACFLIVPFIWCARIAALGLRSWTEPHGRGNVYWRVVAFVPYGLLLSAFMIFCIRHMRLI
ncbi:MAG: hypothetical protein F4X56_08235 [Gammaproteobacteria bacterium]|nr:hypothetical protein [Gammaproteobacteria bacterium]MYC25888.1 hypothetical protein [Gammaproteobacteria bacterium]